MKRSSLCVTLCICILISMLLGACASDGPVDNQLSAEPSTTTIPGVSSSETGGTEANISKPTDEQLWTKYLYLIEEDNRPPELSEYPLTWDVPGSPTCSLYATLSIWDRNSDYLPKVKEAFKDVVRGYEHVGGSYVYLKQMLEILGEIPENTPNITLEQAKAVCDALTLKKQSSDAMIPVDEILQNLNAYAAAPDKIIYWDLYYEFRYLINEDGSECIRIECDRFTGDFSPERIVYQKNDERVELFSQNIYTESE